jgi:hypothetical protein
LQIVGLTEPTVTIGSFSEFCGKTSPQPLKFLVASLIIPWLVSICVSDLKIHPGFVKWATLPIRIKATGSIKAMGRIND